MKSRRTETRGKVDTKQARTADSAGQHQQVSPEPTERGGAQASQPIRIRPDIPPDNWVAISEIVRTLPQATWGLQWSTFAKKFGKNDVESAAVALLLRDYNEQGWGLTLTDSTLWLIPPRAGKADGESPTSVKRRLRSWLEAARAEQLSNPAVRQFLQKMETPRSVGNKRVSVLNLMDNGPDLAAQLSDIARRPESDVMHALGRVIKPTIEIATSASIDEATGLRLIDIWRYFRHTWSIKYRPTPGRTLLFLIRNDARPNRPVMGIGSLANPTLQITTRDDHIGWSLRAIITRIAQEPSFWPRIRQAMLAALRRERQALRKSDLLKQAGNVRGVQLERRLLSLSEEADRQRQTENKERAKLPIGRVADRKSLRQLPLKKSGEIDWKKASSAPLFVAKRARLLSQLLFAERILRKTRSIPKAEDLRSKSDIVRAIGVGAREIRKVGLASRILELNVCGAVPPYNDLLVGKLTALAASSAEIRAAYAERYSSQPSEIASQMSGREVYRSVDVSMVTTTSLYGVSSSQYNRLTISVAGPSGTHQIEWKEIGVTAGKGTAQFSDETTTMLRAAAVRRFGSRRVNNVFGEGQSPLLRQIREALAAIGMPEDLLLHGSPRRMYALELFPGGRESLVLNSDNVSELPTFRQIAAAWSERWLRKRITYGPALARIASIQADSVARSLRAPAENSIGADWEAQAMPKELSEPLGLSKTQRPELVRSLYRSLGACADHHDAATVALLHIETAVDSFLRRRAQLGGVIFVTGNPGDGKTHLLKHLSRELAEAGLEVVLDANQLSDQTLAEIIERAYSRRKGGAILAINEGVLVNLLDNFTDRPWAEGVKQYLLGPFWYRDEPAPLDRRICVLDLNLRNNLAPTVLRKAINLLRKLSSPCPACPKTSCSLALNSSRLRAESSEQIVRVMEAIGRTGVHATMRDVHGFLGYVLAGSASCEEEIQGNLEPERYWRNVFEGGQGHLFDSARKMDPIRNTDPLVDDALWRSADEQGLWLDTPVSDPRSAGDFASRVEAFYDRKRQALFEYRGAEHLAQSIADGTDRLLRDVLDGSGAAVRKLVALLNRFYDRDDTSTDILHLWVTHRFDAQPARFAAASDVVSARALEVLRPRVRPELAEAFPDYQPMHVILAHREASASDGLRIDRPLISALLASANGLPTAFRRGEPETRIAAFYERLRYRLSDAEDTTVYVKLVDRDTGSNHRVSVDVARNSYVEQ